MYSIRVWRYLSMLNWLGQILKSPQIQHQAQSLQLRPQAQITLLKLHYSLVQVRFNLSLQMNLN